MSWAEIAKPSLEVDWYGNVAARRYFRVWNVNPEAIKNPTTILGGPNNVGLPNYGSQFGSSPEVLLRKYSTNGNGLVFDATAEYSSFVGDELIHGSFQTESISFPFAVLVSATFGGLAGQPGATTAFKWDIGGEGRDFATMERLYVKRRLALKYNVWRPLVKEQVGKLHNIEGTWYRFEAPDFRELSDKYWEIDYSFVTDSGNKTLTLGTIGDVPPGSVIKNPPQVQRFPPVTSPDELWARPPHTELRIAPNPTQYGAGVTPPDPVFTFVCKYEISVGTSGQADGLGWKKIPGLSNGIV